MKNKKILTLIIVNVLFLVATVVTDILYITKGNEYVFKTLASSVFVLCSLVNMGLMFIYKNAINKPFIILMVIGQIFAFAGDILLIDYFIIGAISFAVGHIFYFIAYCFLQKFKWLDLAFIGGAITLSLIIIFVSKINLGSNLPLILGYALVISCMLGKSATLFLSNVKIGAENVHIGAIIFTGSLMFYLSDMFLMFTIFGSLKRTGSILCLSFYYPAEFILAMSISAVSYLINKSNDTKGENQND